MPDTMTGARLRERRQDLGMRQADAAMAAGISPSYLNLIEHDRRRATPAVLARLGHVLGLEPLSMGAEQRAALAEELRAAAARDGAEDPGRAEDFAARFPGWAALLSRLSRRAEGLERRVEALNDRMTHDPHLSDAVHEVLSAVASVRSTAAILAETDDIDPEWQARFLRNLNQDSARLAEGAQALVGWLDTSEKGAVQGIASPQEEVEDWLATHGWQARSGDAGTLASGAGRALARAAQAQEAEDAAALPDAALAAAMAWPGPDPLRLAAETGAPVLAAFRRIACAPGSVAGLVICDGSGTLTFRKPAEGFAFPRFGAACPLWPLYAALGRPTTPVAALVETSGRVARRFRALAFCAPSFPQGFAGPELRQAAMLILPEDEAGMAAATGPVLPPVLPVGSSCRVCPRRDCAARREPSILSDAA